MEVNGPEDRQFVSELMKDRARLDAVVKAALNGDGEAHEIIALATTLFNEGAEVAAPSGRLVRLTDLTKMLSAPTSAAKTATTKRADVAQENTTVDKHETKKGMFDNLILGHESRIEKSADVAEYEMTPGGLRRVDPMIVLDSPKPTSEEEMYPTPANASFPSEHVPFAANGHPANVMPVVMPFDVTSGGTMPPAISPNYPAPGDGETKTPANYSPSVPADRPQGAPAADLDDVVDPFAVDEDVDDMKKSTKSIRLGSGYVFARKRRA